jgi:hypothetical protein
MDSFQQTVFGSTVIDHIFSTPKFPTNLRRELQAGGTMDVSILYEIMGIFLVFFEWQVRE